MSATTPDHIARHGDDTPEAGQLDLSRPSGKRTTTSGCASVFMIVATLLAVIPLVWLLSAAIRRGIGSLFHVSWCCLLYTSPSPRDRQKSRMPSSA